MTNEAPKPKRTRTQLFNVRLHAGEYAMLSEVAEHMGLSLADTFRQLLRRAHEELPKRAKRAR